jgi:hypothetical protein
LRGKIDELYVATRLHTYFVRVDLIVVNAIPLFDQAIIARRLSMPAARMQRCLNLIMQMREDGIYAGG